MRNFIILLFIFLSFKSWAKEVRDSFPIPYQQLGYVGGAVNNNGGMFINGTFTPPIYLDTIHANLDPNCKLYEFSIIGTSNDGNFWYRNYTIKKWVQISTGTGAVPTLYTSDGNLPSSGTRILHGSNTELDVNNVTTLLMIDTVTGHGYYHLIEPNHHQSILSLGNPYTSFTTLSTSTDTTDDESDVSLFTTIHNNPFFIAKNSRSKNTSLAFSDNNADSIITFKGIGNPINIKNLQQGSTSDSVITRDAVGNLKVVAQSSISGIDTTSWKITGNNIYDTSHYIGTNNNEPFIVKANNTRIGYFTPNIGILGDPYGLSDSLSVRWNQGFETMDFGNSNYINGGTGIALSHGAHSLVLHALNGVGINGTANGGDGLYVKNRILGDSISANNISTSTALLKSEGINRGTVVPADSTKDYATHTALVDSAAAIRASSGGGSGNVTTMHDSTTNGVTTHWVNPTTTPAPIVTLGNITPTTVSTNSINLLPQGSATPPPATGNTLFDSSGINYRGSNGVTIGLSKASLTVNRVDSFPDESGVFLLRKDSTIYQSAATASHGTVISVAMGGDGTVFNSSVSGSPITISGTLTPSLSTQTSYKIFGNNTGSTATPTFFSPTLASALFANQGTTTTLLHGNASGNPSWSAVNLANDVTGVLGVANGGTGSSTGTFWGLTGNALLNRATNYLGSSDTSQVHLKTKGIDVIVIDSSQTANMPISNAASTGTTLATVLNLVNNTAATSGNTSQYSPSIVLSGNGWSASTSTSQSAQVRISNKVFGNGTNAAANMIFDGQANGSGYSTLMGLQMNASANAGLLTGISQITFISSNGGGNPILSATAYKLFCNGAQLGGEGIVANPGGTSAARGNSIMDAVGLMNANSITVGTAGIQRPSASLEDSSTTTGFLIPFMSTAQKNAISNPGQALGVYDTSFKKKYLNNGKAWIPQLDSTSIVAGTGVTVTPSAGGILTIRSSIQYAHAIFTPTTGTTVNLVNNQYNIINPAGALLALTVALPSSPANNDVVYIKFTQSVTTVSYTGGTVVDGIVGPVSGSLLVLTFDSSSSSWY